MRPDDFKPGQYVVVTHEKEDDPPESPWGIYPRHQPELVYTGEPLKILAVSLPFIAVTDGLDNFAIDTRGKQFSRVSLQYVRAMTPDLTEKRSPALLGSPVASKPDEKFCPRCGVRRIQRLVKRNWVVVCPECGLVKEGAK